MVWEGWGGVFCGISIIFVYLIALLSSGHSCCQVPLHIYMLEYTFLFDVQIKFHCIISPKRRCQISWFLHLKTHTYEAVTAQILFYLSRDTRQVARLVASGQET